MPTVKSDSWTIFLPDDWEQKETTESGSLSFECADGSKGLFVTTWDLGTEVSRSPADVANAFQRMSAAALDSMDGYRWTVVAEQTSASDRTSAILERSRRPGQQPSHCDQDYGASTGGHSRIVS